jgi:hypothetical protein
MSSFPLLTPGKPVLPPPVVGQRTDDGDGGGDDYTLGSDQNPSDELLTILMFSNGWVMTKDGGEASGDSSLFVERLVPEPGTILILSTGVLSLAGRRRKR